MITLSRNQLLVGEEGAVFIADVALAKYVENTQDGDLLNYAMLRQMFQWCSCLGQPCSRVSPQYTDSFTRMVLAESI